jgi:hypothetical protein
MSLPTQKPVTTPIPVQLSANEFDALGFLRIAPFGRHCG